MWSMFSIRTRSLTTPRITRYTHFVDVLHHMKDWLPCRQGESGTVPKNHIHRGCMLLSPTLLWRGGRDEFANDENVLRTVFAGDCKARVCVRDLLMGMPLRLTNVRKSYNTNRQRSEFFLVLVPVELKISPQIRDHDRHGGVQLRLRRESSSNVQLLVDISPALHGEWAGLCACVVQVR